MIDVKDAAQTAKRYFLDLTDKEVYQLMIEEVELDEDERYWSITIGYDPETFSQRRFYKVVRLKADTGTVVSMKFREPI